jgi:hypothetical protein
MAFAGCLRSRRRLVGLLILLILVSFSALYTTAFAPVRVNAGYVSTQTATINNAAMVKTCAALVFSDGTQTYWQSCDTGALLFHSTDSSAVLNDIIGNLTGGGTIYLRESVNVDGLVTINHSFISLVSDQKFTVLDTSGTPYIRQIKIDSSSAAIHGITIRGLRVKELHLYANGRGIIGVSVTNSAIMKDGTYHGLILQGDGTENGFIDQVSVRDSVLVHIDGTDGATWGLITYTNVRDVTGILFDGDEFEGYLSTQTMFLCKGDSQPDQLTVRNSKFYTDTGTSGVRIFYQLTPTVSYLVGFYAKFDDNTIEAHTDMTFFEAQTHSGTYEYRLGLQVTNNQWYASSGKTITFMQVAETDWGSAPDENYPYIVFSGNAGSVNATSLGGFRLGTLPSPYSVQALIANNAPNMTPTGFLTTTPAVPSSGTGYRNNFGYRIRIYILTASGATCTFTDRFGNTGSSITLAVGQEITLDPGETITPTYSTLTWQFYAC